MPIVDSLSLFIASFWPSRHPTLCAIPWASLLQTDVLALAMVPRAGFLVGTHRLGDAAYTITVDRFDPGVRDPRTGARKPMVAVPGDVAISVVESDTDAPSAAIIGRDIQAHCAGLEPLSLPQLLPTRGLCSGPNPRAADHSPAQKGESREAAAAAAVQLQTIRPTTSFAAVRVPQLPILRTALARKIYLVTDDTNDLATLAVQPETGFLTMNSTRNVVLVRCPPKKSPLP
jgi:hypothetical protein